MIKKSMYFLFAKISIISLKILITSVDYMTKLALLIKIFFMSGFIYLILDLRFLGLTYIIVYVGAISILFLFVIKMTQAGRSPKLLNKKENSLRIDFLLIFLSKIFLGLYNKNHLFLNYKPNDYIFHFFQSSYSSEFLTKTDIESFGFILYLGKPLIIVLIGVLLWCILIGILRISQPN